MREFLIHAAGLCVTATLVGNAPASRQRSRERSFVSCGGALSTGCCGVAQFGRVCSTTGHITSGLRGPSPQALTLFGGVGFIARRLRCPEKGNADGVRGIFGTAYRVGLRPCDRPTLKTALCHIRTLVGRRINTAPGPVLDFGPERSPGKEQWQTWGL